MTIHDLPAVNASLNALAGVFLGLGWLAIKKGDQKRHRVLMIMALCASTLFLCSYLYYHAHVGSVHYPGHGILRTIYFLILLTHTPLAAIIVPFCVIAVWHAVHKNFTAHKKITRWLWPTWMYVSVTGVVIYLMLYVFKS